MNQEPERESIQTGTGSGGADVENTVRKLIQPRNVVTIEVRSHFELDEARIFDLNGKGLTVTVVAVN